MRQSSHASPSDTRPRASHSGCSDEASAKAPVEIVVFATPDECGPQVVDLGLRPAREVLLVSRRRRVEPLGHRRVVIAVAGANVVGFAGFAEFLQRVLAHRLQ